MQPKELDALLAQAKQWGIETGLHGLADEFPARLAAALLVEAEPLLGDWGPEPEWYQSRQADAEARMRTASEAAAAYRARRESRQAATPAHPPARLISVALMFLSAGLIIELAAGVSLGLRAWTVLGAAALLLAINSSSVAAAPGRLAERWGESREYRRNLRSVRRAAAELERLHSDIAAWSERRSRAAELVARFRSLIEAEYRFHKMRAALARQLEA
jgi:hypothetical protein